MSVTSTPNKLCNTLSEPTRKHRGCRSAGSWASTGDCSQYSEDGSVWTGLRRSSCGVGGAQVYCRRTRAPNSSLSTCCLGNGDNETCGPDLCVNSERCANWFEGTYCRGDNLINKNICKNAPGGWGRFNLEEWKRNMSNYCTGEKLDSVDACRQFVKNYPASARSSIRTYCTADRMEPKLTVPVCRTEIQTINVFGNTINIPYQVCEDQEVPSICREYALRSDVNSELVSAVDEFCGSHPDDPFCGCQVPDTTDMSWDDAAIAANPQCFNGVCRGPLAYKSSNQISGYDCPKICLANVTAIGDAQISDVNIEQNCGAPPVQELDPVNPPVNPLVNPPVNPLVNPPVNPLVNPPVNNVSPSLFEMAHSSVSKVIPILDNIIYFILFMVLILLTVAGGVFLLFGEKKSTGGYIQWDKPTQNKHN